MNENFAVADYRKETLLIPLQAGNEGNEREKDELVVGGNKAAVAPEAPKTPLANKWNDVVDAAPVQHVAPATVAPVVHTAPVQQVQTQKPVQDARSLMNAFLGVGAPVQPTGQSNRFIEVVDATGRKVMVNESQLAGVQQGVDTPPWIAQQTQQPYQQNVPTDGFGRPLMQQGQAAMNPNAPMAPIGLQFGQPQMQQQQMGFGYQQPMNQFGQAPQQGFAQPATGGSFNFAAGGARNFQQQGQQQSGMFNSNNY